MERDCYKDAKETVMTKLHLKQSSSKYQNNFKYLIIFSNYIFILCWNAHTLWCTYGEQLEGVGSFHHLWGFQEWNSGCQAWQQMPYPLSHHIIPYLSYLNDTFEYLLFKKVSYLALTLEPKVLQRQSTVSLCFYLFYLYVCACAGAHTWGCSQKVKIENQTPGAQVV